MSPPFNCPLPFPPQKFGITLLFFGDKIQQIFKKLLQMNAKSTLGRDGCQLLVLQKNSKRKTLLATFINPPPILN